MATARVPQLDRLFGALADPTRRAIVERLLARGELASAISRRHFDQHAGDLAPPAGAGARRADRAPRRAPMALHARATRGVGAGRILGRATARALDAALDRLDALAAGNPEAEEIMSEIRSCVSNG